MWQRLKSAVFSRQYHPLNKIAISLTNLTSNFNYLSSLNSNCKIAPILKSNAYGHGLKEVSRLIDQLKPPLVCIDSLFEAYELQKASIQTPILIMGFVDPQNLKIKKVPFCFSLFDLNLSQALNNFQPGALVHLFVDTGMNREGLLLKDLRSFIREIKGLNIQIEGLMSHLSSADEEKKGNSQTQKQIQNFNEAIKICREEGLNLKWTHLQASAGFLHHQVPQCNLARVGLGLYGLDPANLDQNLKPVLTFQTKLIQIKKIPKGENIGYGATFQTKKETLIGILPVGYFDGLDQRLSNRGMVTVGGIICPIIGKVSMNITTIDLSFVSDPILGQEVVIFSNNPKDPNSIINSAKLCKVVPYEILVKLNPTIHREIIN